MLSDSKITDISYLIADRFEAVNSYYLELIGKHIKEIGKLSPSDLHRLEQMQKMSMNIDEINKRLSQATALSVNELKQLYDISGMSVYGDATKWYLANGKNQIPFEQNHYIQNQIDAIKRQTAGSFLNISNTTSIQQDYRNLVDNAITAVSTGVGDYMSVIRAQMTDTALQGIRVQYASGLTRRLDSAIRMNVLEGVRQVNNFVRERAGEEFGADGVELSAHALCAADHIDYQGRQFAIGYNTVTVNGVEYEGFDAVNESLRRKISTCNCKHTKFPIILGISQPANSEEELRSYRNNSEQRVNITTGYKKTGVDDNGNNIYEPVIKRVTKYEATQYQRNTETEIRRAKDLKILAEASGDSVLEEQAKLKIKELRAKYKRISQEAGLTPKWDRCYVPGYNGKQTTPKAITLQSRTIKNVIETDFKHTGILSSNDLSNMNKTIIKHTKETVSELNERYPNILEYLSKNGTQFNIKDDNSYGIMSAVTSINNKGPYISEFVFANTSKNSTIYSSYKSFKSYVRTQTNSERQWFMPCDETNLGKYLVSHEYGHIVQNYLMSIDDTIKWSKAKTGQELTTMYNDICKKHYNELGKIIMNNKLADSWGDAIDQLSGYAVKRAGKDSVFSDVFAESFANMVCGKPNCWGKAMKLFLEKRGL